MSGAGRDDASASVPASEVARELERRGLIAPALLLLEAHRPLRPLLAIGASFLSPLTRPLLGPAAGSVARALDSETEFDALLDRLRDEARG